MIRAKARSIPDSRPLRLAAGLAFLLALSLLLVGSARAQAGLGEPAPDFTRTGNDGAVYTLSDVFGQQVQLIYFIGYS